MDSARVSPFGNDRFRLRRHAWSSSGGVLFHNLAPGTTMTLRANAPGYSPLEKAVVAAVSGQAVDFALEPIPQS